MLLSDSLTNSENNERLAIVMKIRQLQDKQDRLAMMVHLTSCSSSSGACIQADVDLRFKMLTSYLVHEKAGVSNATKKQS